jgi:hypothetical protein
MTLAETITARICAATTPEQLRAAGPSDSERAQLTMPQQWQVYGATELRQLQLQIDAEEDSARRER